MTCINTSLLANVSENFRNKCPKIYEPHPANFFSTPRLARQTTLKTTKVKSDLLTHIDILLIAEKFMREGIWQYFYWYANGNKKYLEDYNENK